MRILFSTFCLVLFLSTNLFAGDQGLVKDIKDAQELLKEYSAEFHIEDEIKNSYYQVGRRIYTKTKRVRTLKSSLVAVVQNSHTNQIIVVNMKVIGGYDQGIMVVPENQNGVNTRYSIYPSGYRILAIRRAIMPSGKLPFEVIYTPYSNEINTREVQEAGVDYLNAMLQSAAHDLKKQEIYSLAFANNLVTDVIPLSVAYSLAVIEHIDPTRFQNEGIVDCHGETLIILGANQKNAYKYAVSPAGARGLFQFMPGTYMMIRQKYPEAKLIRNFEEGMNNHLNAAKATILLFDYQLTALHAEEKLLALRDDGFMGRYLAAAYNCGQNCAHRVIDQAGDDWVNKIPYRETAIYVQKYEAVQELYH